MNELGLAGAIGMHLGLLVFGWVLTIWGVVMLVTFGLLLRAQRRLAATTPFTDADNSRARQPDRSPRRPALEAAGRHPRTVLLVGGAAQVADQVAVRARKLRIAPTTDTFTERVH